MMIDAGPEYNYQSAARIEQMEMDASVSERVWQVDVPISRKKAYVR